MLLFANNIK